MIEGFELARPWALAGALPALALLAVAFRPNRPATVVLGTFRMLADAGADERTTRGSRRSLPPYAAFAALAVTLACAAASGPRWGALAPPVTWSVVVDGRGSMAVATDGRTRAEVGAERAAALVARLAEVDDRVRWRLPDGRELELGVGELPSAEDLSNVPDRALRPAAHDGPATVLVTDLVPTVALEHAGFVATGARPAPGPIGVERGALLVWDGGAVVRSGPPPTRVVVVDPDLPVTLAEYVALWAAERGLRSAAEASAGEAPALVVERSEGAGDGAARRVARDGWSARVVGPSLAVEGPHAEAWLGDDQGVVVVAAPGRVTVGASTFEPSRAEDPARFAVSFGALLDRVTRTPEGCVALAERLRSGAADERTPEPPVRAAGRRDFDRPLAAWLAAAAAVAAVAAWSLYASGSATSSSSTAP